MSVSDKLSGTMLLSSNTDVSQMFHRCFTFLSMKCAIWSRGGMHIFTFKNNNKQTENKNKTNIQIPKLKSTNTYTMTEYLRALVHSSTKPGVSVCMEDRLWCQPCSSDEVICISLFNRVSANLPSHHNRAAIFFNYIWDQFIIVGDFRYLSTPEIKSWEEETERQKKTKG